MADPAGADPAVTITTGGDRTGGNAVQDLTDGVRFTAPGATPDACTTGTAGTGRCTVTSTGSRTFTQDSAPPGWFLSRYLGASPNSSTSAVTERDYSTVTASTDTTTSVPVSTSGTATDPTARSGIWAVSRDNPALPPRCGLNVALLFDLSYSIGSNLGILRSAGTGFVNALDGTPSSVGLYTFGTTAPAPSTTTTAGRPNNSNVALTGLTATGAAADLNRHVNGFTIPGASNAGGTAQYTNWDAGIWQMASAEPPAGTPGPRYNVAIVLTDGDPTVYGPTGIGQRTPAITRFIDVENGIFSANALKARGTRVIAVGIHPDGTTLSAGSVDNLKAISGPDENSDWFSTTFGHLGVTLKDLALENCRGTVNVTKLVIPPGGAAGDATPAPGWQLGVSPAVPSTPADRVTDANGAVSFDTGTSTAPTTITETVKPGYTLHPVAGDNATCENTATSPPTPVTVTNTADGFTVTPDPTAVINCALYNQEAPVPEVTTELSPSGQIPVGASAHDTATLTIPASVAPPAGSSLEYRYYPDEAACDADVRAFPATPPSRGTPAGTVPVTHGGTQTSSGVVSFPGAGTRYWAAFFTSGHPDVLGSAASVCATEPLVVPKAEPEIDTETSADEITVSGSMTDTATLTGGHAPFAPGTTVAFRIYGSEMACDDAAADFRTSGTASGGDAVGTPVPVTANGPVTSAGHTFTRAGTFFWAAFFSGDGNNERAVSACAAESVVVDSTTPDITTHMTPREFTVPGAVTDTATLTSPHTPIAPGTTMDYRFYDSAADCDADRTAFLDSGTAPAGGTHVATVDVAPDGTVPPASRAFARAGGPFFWAAFFSGDANNKRAVSACAAETAVVHPAAAQITTTLSPASHEITIGGSAHDTAAFEAGTTHNPSGTVQYRVYDSRSGCEDATDGFTGTFPGSGTLVSEVTVRPDGTVPDSAAHAFPDEGTFFWAAFYSGDHDNKAAASICATEPLVVAPPPPGPATVTVNKEWVVNGVRAVDPGQDADFQSGLSLSPLFPAGQSATWGEERFGYTIGQRVRVAETGLRIPSGCVNTVSGETGTHVLTRERNTFTVRNTVTCGSRLTLVKEIRNPFAHVVPVPLTAWTLTARRAPGAPAAISGTTGVTGAVEPGVRYVLAESKVPGYQQRTGPAVISLTRGATGSWRCVEDLPGGSGVEDFDGGTGTVVVQPGRHVTCTAVNLLKRVIPVGPAPTGGGFARSGASVPLVAGGAGLVFLGGLLGLAGLRIRRRGGCRA